MKKSILVKGYKERMDLEEFEKDNTIVPEKPGVYSLYHNDNLYYVGKSLTNIRERIYAHNKPTSRKYGNWNNFSFYLMPFKKRMKYIHDTEALIIRIATTLRNKKIALYYYNKQKAKFVYKNPKG
jgi:hypothetical protein